MKTKLISGALFLISTGAFASPPSQGNWVQIWNDEFDSVPSSCGSSTIDCTKWDVTWDRNRDNIGTINWRHNAQPNVTQSGGILSHVYTRESSNTIHSGYATTHELFGTTYGYIETRLQVTGLLKTNAQTAFWISNSR